LRRCKKREKSEKREKKRKREKERKREKKRKREKERKREKKREKEKIVTGSSSHTGQDGTPKDGIILELLSSFHHKEEDDLGKYIADGGKDSSREDGNKEARNHLPPLGLPVLIVHPPDG
jgi:septal ring factor EnvC (AmiA/AmiB activator)